MEIPENCTDKQILRMIMISELNTINEYEQLLEKTSDESIKIIIDKIIDDEKDHLELAEDKLDEIDPEEENETPEDEAKEQTETQTKNPLNMM
jgi:rubrerythrin